MCEYERERRQRHSDKKDGKTYAVCFILRFVVTVLRHSAGGGFGADASVLTLAGAGTCNAKQRRISNI
jgi:hypothetical protein